MEVCLDTDSLRANLREICFCFRVKVRKLFVARRQLFSNIFLSNLRCTCKGILVVHVPACTITKCIIHYIVLNVSMHKVNKSENYKLINEPKNDVLCWRKKAPKTSKDPVVNLLGERLPVELSTTRLNGVSGGSAVRALGMNCVRSLTGQPKMYS